MVEQMSGVFEQQEEAKKVNSGRVRNLLDRVRGLETGSWDRADAKEDLGSAAQ